MMRTLVLAALLLGQARADRSADDLSDSSFGERLVSVSAHADGHMVSVSARADGHVESHRTNGTQLKAFPADGYICCLQGLNIDQNAYPTDLVEVRFSDQSSIGKCILTAFPPLCQTTGLCDSECKKILGTSVRFHTLRYTTSQLAMQKAVEQTGTEETAAEATKNKAVQKLNKDHAKELKRIDSEYEKKVKPVNDAAGKAYYAQQSQDKVVEKLEEQLKQAKQLAAEAKRTADNWKTQLDKVRGDAKKEKESATTKAKSELTKESGTLDNTYKAVLTNGEKVRAAWKKKVDTIRAQVTKVQGDGALAQKVSKGFGSCAKDNNEFEGEDCCCSLIANNMAVAMRVVGQSFVNWDVCIAGSKYSNTAFHISGCNWFGDCGMCTKLICSKSGVVGACPRE